MAELDTSQGGGKHKGKGGKRTKKKSTRVDLTPMVDLGFLLVTFFMLTTTFSKPQTMEINMPVKNTEIEKEDQTQLKASNAMTIILGADNVIYYYFGLPNAPEGGVQKTNYSKEGLRKVLLERYHFRPELFVMIKALDGANYRNVVDVLDEMLITNIKRYALVDINDVDLDLIKNM